MGFTLGTLQHAMDPEMRTHLAIDADGKVQGVTTWLPIHREGHVVGWTLDLMRRRPDGFRPVMEYLIAESALLFQQQGFEVMSLSVAPLARRTRPLGRRTMLDRTLDAMSAVLEPTYGFTSLLAFKAKFHPQFRPVYLLYSSPSDLLGISLAIGRAYLPQVKPRELVGLLRALSTRAAD
jgi:phosphatidylglycerol lysyltransferase